MPGNSVIQLIRYWQELFWYLIISFLTREPSLGSTNLSFSVDAQCTMSSEITGKNFYFCSVD